jgi:hypothetical protein
VVLRWDEDVAHDGSSKVGEINTRPTGRATQSDMGWRGGGGARESAKFSRNVNLCRSTMDGR